jgi:hypothetical protein
MKLKELKKEINKWVEENNQEGIFIRSFIDKDDDTLIIYGNSKNSLRLMISEIKKLLSKEKEDFVNW